jgi:hypothetical protein
VITVAYLEESEREANTDEDDAMLVVRECDSSDNAQTGWVYHTSGHGLSSTGANQSVHVDPWYAGVRTQASNQCIYDRIFSS